MRYLRGLALVASLVLIGGLAWSAESEVGTTGSRFTPVGGQYLSSPATLAADGYRVLRVNSSGELLVTSTLGFGGGIDAVSSFAATVSSGTNAITLVSATASKRVYPTTLFVTNQNAATTYLVTIQTSGGQALFAPFKLSAGQSFVFDGRGDVSTSSGDALQFKLDQAGTDVYVSGFYVTK